METTSLVQSITDEQIAEIEEYVNFYSDPTIQPQVSYAEIQALISRMRDAERDAARYQFLRDTGKFSPSAFGDGWALNCGYTRAQPSLLDAAVDAAMKGDQQ